MKNRIAILISALILASMLFACSNFSKSSSENSTAALAELSANDSGKINVVATIFPEYDWIRTILGDETENINLSLLLDNGVDLHSFQPSADDLIKVSNCDMFIYVGGESDEWIEEILAQSENKNMKVLNLLDILEGSLREEELKEGMKGAHDEEKHASESGEEPEYDEHVWLSLKNAKIICQRLADELAVLDPENKEIYLANAASYIEELTVLDKDYQNVVSQGNKNTILFGDRFPFLYLTGDYNLNYYAAFVGCSAETEASFETITFLANKIDELELSHIFTIDGTKPEIARTIISCTKKKNQQILTLNSLQSVTKEDLENGITYLSVMKDNLVVLKTALE